MTDAISNQPRIPMSNTALLKSVSNSSSSAVSSSGGNASNSPATASVVALSSGSDTVSLSNVTQQISEQPGFDQTKVDAIKQAIQSGNYAIDPRRIAEGFTSLEKMIKE
jgi:negative regulator of flagellin synthesis FlgM